MADWHVYGVCVCGLVTQAPGDTYGFIDDGVCRSCGRPRYVHQERKVLRWDRRLQDYVERVTVSDAGWWNILTWFQSHDEERALSTGRRVGEPIVIPTKVVSQRTVDACRSLYWVLDDPPSIFEEARTTNPFGWVLCRVEPCPVPNQRMKWRRPTYQECIERQAAYEADPTEFLRRTTERSKNLRQYAAMGEREARKSESS